MVHANELFEKGSRPIAVENNRVIKDRCQSPPSQTDVRIDYSSGGSKAILVRIDAMYLTIKNILPEGVRPSKYNEVF